MCIRDRRRRAAVAAGFALAAALAIPAAARVEVQDSWLSGFSPRSAFHRSTLRVDELFAGTHLLQLHVDARAVAAEGVVAREDFDEGGVQIASAPPLELAHLAGHRLVIESVSDDPQARRRELDYRITGAERTEAGLRLQLEGRYGRVASMLPTVVERWRWSIDARDRMLTPAALERARALEDYLAERLEPSGGRVLGPCELLETTSYMRAARREGTRTLPGDPARMNLLIQDYERARGARRLRELFTPEFDGALVTAFLAGVDFARSSALLADLAAFEAEHLAPHGYALRPAGDTPEGHVLIESIVRTQLRSLLFSFGAILAVASLLGRSLWAGLLATLPAALAVLFVFAGMGLFGVPLGVATSMFAAMAIGLGVDQAIHLVSRFRAGAGGERDGRILDALAFAGPPAVVDAAAVALGLGVLVFSNVPANARLGGLLVAGTSLSLAGSLLLLPVLLRVRGRAPR